MLDLGGNLIALAARLARGDAPLVLLRQDGRLVGKAVPMLDVTVSIRRMLDDVLARAVTLTVATAQKALCGQLPDIAAPPVPAPSGSLFTALVFGLLPRAVGELTRRTRFRAAHWRVGYRFITGPGVAETGSIAGAPWSVLPDDGTHFYADPFAIHVEGRDFIFVEDFDHALGKAGISVIEFDDSHHPSPPRPVLQERYHLSYPQVFAREGGIFMLPESSAGRTVTLYRAVAFPDRWQPYVELIAGREISDATLLEHGGRHWLLATDRDGAGSTSDTLVVYSAPRLEGPWVPHRDNPILIDRAGARPGGAPVVVEGRILLPVQDGTTGYGGGLSLSEIVRLDDEAVTLFPPVPVGGTEAWPYPQVHTLNRAGRLEVIDGIAAVPRRGSTSQLDGAGIRRRNPPAQLSSRA